MSHHLAELMNRAEQEDDVEKKRDLESQTSDLIIKIWSHRGSLNQNAYPLSRFSKIIESLSILSPEANVWERNKLGKYESLAADVFSMIVNLFRALHFIEFASLKSVKSKKVPPSVLTDEEENIYNFLVSWAEEEMNFRASHELSSDKNEAHQVSEFLCNYIDELRNKLNSLKLELSD